MAGKADNIDLFNQQLDVLKDRLLEASIPAEKVKSILEALGANPDSLERYSQALQEQKRIAKELTDAENELKTARNNQGQKNKAIEDLETKITNLKLKNPLDSNEIKKAEEEIVNLKTKIEELKQLENTPVNNNKIAQLEKEKAAYENNVKIVRELAKAQEELDKLNRTNPSDAKNIAALDNKIEELRRQKEEIDKQINDKTNSIDTIGQKINKTQENFQPSHMLSPIESITKTAAGLGQVAMAISSIRSMINTFQDDSASLGEKITAGFMGISMAIPSIIKIWQLLFRLQPMLRNYKQ